jgi:hypothetical protein
MRRCLTVPNPGCSAPFRGPSTALQRRARAHLEASKSLPKDIVRYLTMYRLVLPDVSLGDTNLTRARDALRALLDTRARY